MDFILGGATLVWGDSAGEIRGGFLVRKAELTGQGLYDVERDAEKSIFALAFTKIFAEEGPVLRAIGPSPRTRLMVCGMDNGEIAVFHVTSAAELARSHIEGGKAVTRIRVSTKEDGILALTDEGAYRFAFDPKASRSQCGLPFHRGVVRGLRETPAHVAELERR